MTGVQTCALPICFPVTIPHLDDARTIVEWIDASVLDKEAGDEVTVEVWRDTQNRGFSYKVAITTADVEETVSKLQVDGFYDYPKKVHGAGFGPNRTPG